MDARRTALGLTLVLALAALPHARTPSRSAPARLQGILQIGEFLGPPNYGDDPRTDRREPSYYLQLPAPIGAQNPGLKHGPDLADATEYFVQLVIVDEAQRKRAKGLFGQKVAVTAELEPAMTAHHRTAVIAVVQKLETIQDWRW